jgi:DNA (cytosine-5)-methyltransferase 1
MPIPIIDLFAGPGGLGEGFTSVLDKNGKRVFKIALSIEKDEFAHKTLTLRSFLRQFPYGELPREYYEFLRSKEKDLEDLFSKYPEQAKKAKEEAWRFELGNEETHGEIDKRIRESLKGEDFVLIGGPPCQAYSLVGRSRRQQGQGLDKNDPRVYLYREYYRILAVHSPKVFIMENVKGLLSSKVDDQLIFTQLLKDLENPVDSYKKLLGKNRVRFKNHRYKIYSLVKEPEENLLGEKLFQPRDYIIKCEDYGIPQTRHRVILLGIRDDLSVVPDLIPKSNKHIPIDDVIGKLPPLRSGISKEPDSKENWRKLIKEFSNHHFRKDLNGSLRFRIERTIENLVVPKKDRGAEFIECDAKIDYEKEWFSDSKIGGICNHATRSHIREDIYRYLFAASYAEETGVTPKLSEFPKSLLPLHDNVVEGSKKFDDRFRVQPRELPARTITSHISKDGHYYIHPSPTQARSFTVREAARIQTFPDNYFFCGPRTQQYHQVGNAVPPLLAYKIAIAVASMFT